MANFSEEKIQKVWDYAFKVEGNNPNEWRKDSCDAWINRGQYGNETKFGWEVDHILPIAKEGKDDIGNLCALHWKNNRSKADDFPEFQMAVTSNGTENVEHVERRVWNADVLKRLKEIYPNNPYLRQT